MVTEDLDVEAAMIGHKAGAVNLSVDTEGGWYAPAIRISPGASGDVTGREGVECRKGRR